MGISMAKVVATNNIAHSEAQSDVVICMSGIYLGSVFVNCLKNALEKRFGKYRVLQAFRLLRFACKEQSWL